MDAYDVIVVGGGPIGGYISSRLAEKYKVALFEKNKKIGTPLNCAGLITSKVLDFIDISKKDCIQNKIKGANIHSPSNNVLSIGGDKEHALVINRKIFDRQIINLAEKKGIDLFLDNNVLSAFRNKEKIEIKTSKGIEAKTSLIIGADGPFSKVRDRFIEYEPKEYLRGIGAEVTNVNMDPNFVEIFVGKNIAPDFFAWIIPTDKKGCNARVGLCIPNNLEKAPKFYFEKFLNHSNTKPYLKNAKIKEYIGGMIPLGTLKKTYADNVIVVGDAAAQVKPTSGGGLYPGLLCAKNMFSVIDKAFEKSDFSEKILKHYHKNWTKEFGSELNRGMNFRSIYKKLSDAQMDNYVKKFNDPKIIEILNSYGDIDYPSKLVKPLLKKMPFLLKLIPNIIKK